MGKTYRELTNNRASRCDVCNVVVNEGDMQILLICNKCLKQLKQALKENELQKKTD